MSLFRELELSGSGLVGNVGLTDVSLHGPITRKRRLQP
jgi:hypothetical protein